jgi:DNA-binding GntR family transcriptional regulator
MLHIDVEFTEKAYKKLIKENYIKYLDQQGYTVAYFELTNYFFYRNIAIYDAISALGLTPSIECIEKKVVTLSDLELKHMGFDSNEKLLYINRIYKGNDKPIIILANYIPLSIFLDMDKKFNGIEPLNAYMDKEYNIKAKLSFRVTKAVNLTSKLASLLGERKNAASIESTNKVYDQYNRLIDYGQSHTTSSYYFQALVTCEEMLNYYQKETTPIAT